ncbi:hypothetical protein [Sorangium cellulosum]|uniref:hypothetical protein n=1 Tax=Sorangium cellulosum TaxID=56 RepID=UPI0011DE1507|nr:hypothetical protein [Sorangium cellulosum]
MELLSKPTKRIGFGLIAVVALVGAYTLGRTSVEVPEKFQTHQDTASTSGTDLQSIISATQERLISCENALYRREQPLHKKEEQPHIKQDEPTASSHSEGSTECGTISQKKELQMMAKDCREFRKSFDAYKAILENDKIDCETILAIRDLAQSQHSTCVAIITANEDASYQNLMRDPNISELVEDAYTFRDDEYSGLSVNGLVKNKRCLVEQ